MNWIKCSDQLPDKNEYVLTYNTTTPRRPEIAFYSTVHNEWRIIHINPTHWCEWPELPEK